MHNAIRLTWGAGLLMLSAGLSGALVPLAANAEMAKSEPALKYPYPAEVVTGFVNACSTSSAKVPPAVAQQICGCIITSLQNQYSMAEFQKIAQGLDKGTPMPQEMEQITQTCVQQTVDALKK
jgi:hypothetical protein